MGATRRKFETEFRRWFCLRFCLRRGTFHRRKVPKSRRGHRGRRLLQALCPRFPGPLSEYVRRRCYSSATELESSCLPVRLFSVVTPLPEQRYPPRLVSSFNSITFLNAAPGLCAVLPSLPGRIRRASDVPLRALHAHSGDSLFTFPPVSCTI